MHFVENIGLSMMNPDVVCDNPDVVCDNPDVVCGDKNEESHSE